MGNRLIMAAASGVLALAEPSVAQTISHSGTNGQSYTITKIAQVVDPAPLSDNVALLLSGEVASVEAGPWSSEGQAKAWDTWVGYDASAEGSNWHHSEWHIVANNAPSGFELTVAGTMDAGGWTAMLNPACSAFAACAHSAKVDLSHGVREAGVYLSGAATSVAGQVTWGQVTVNVRLPGVKVGWQVTPVFAVHQTGEWPLGENGAPIPQPGKNLDKLDAWGVTTSCKLTVESGGLVRAYADGWYWVVAADASRSAAYAVTHLSIVVGGRLVVVPVD